MESIFIWKADKPCGSNSSMKYFMGSNWVLEDNQVSQKSYKIIEQLSIKNSSLSDTILINNISIMPNNWVGSELLEVFSVPYKIIKSDEYGTFEQFGEWNRFTLHKNINFNNETIRNEMKRILKWLEDSINKK